MLPPSAAVAPSYADWHMPQPLPSVCTDGRVDISIAEVPNGRAGGHADNRNDEVSTLRADSHVQFYAGQ